MSPDPRHIVSDAPWLSSAGLIGVALCLMHPACRLLCWSPSYFVWCPLAAVCWADLRHNVSDAPWLPSAVLIAVILYLMPLATVCWTDRRHIVSDASWPPPDGLIAVTLCLMPPGRCLMAWSPSHCSWCLLAVVWWPDRRHIVPDASWPLSTAQVQSYEVIYLFFVIYYSQCSYLRIHSKVKRIFCGRLYVGPSKHIQLHSKSRNAPSGFCNKWMQSAICTCMPLSSIQHAVDSP